jgi:hypothetical protein
VIYVGSLAGLVPGGPGHSHQSVRDISALGAMPGMALIEPFSEHEARAAVSWAVHRAPGSVYLRLVSVPWALGFEPPAVEELSPGRGTLLRSAGEILFVAAGPVWSRRAGMRPRRSPPTGSRPARRAAPAARDVDGAWLAEVANGATVVTRGQPLRHRRPGRRGVSLRPAEEAPNRVHKIGVTSIPKSGGNDDALKAHGSTPRASRARCAGVSATTGFHGPDDRHLGYGRAWIRFDVVAVLREFETRQLGCSGVALPVVVTHRDGDCREHLPCETLVRRSRHPAPESSDGLVHRRSCPPSCVECRPRIPVLADEPVRPALGGNSGRWPGLVDVSRHLEALECARLRLCAPVDDCPATPRVDQLLVGERRTRSRPKARGSSREPAYLHQRRSRPLLPCDRAVQESPKIEPPARFDVLAVGRPEHAALLAKHDYFSDRRLATSVFLALKLRRPLFLEGEAGVGKTEIAKVLAVALGRSLVRLHAAQHRTRSRRRDVLFTFDWRTTTPNPASREEKSRC